MIVSALLASLGFYCILPAPAYGTPPNEYGSPSATFKARGFVVSEEDDSPIEGIRVELKRTISSFYAIDRTYTGSDGFFFLQGSDFPVRKLYVEFIDVDGETNGLFERKVIEADYSNETFTGSSGAWYDGSAEIDLGIIKMKPE